MNRSMVMTFLDTILPLGWIALASKAAASIMLRLGGWILGIGLLLDLVFLLYRFVGYLSEAPRDPFRRLVSQRS